MGWLARRIVVDLAFGILLGSAGRGLVRRALCALAIVVALLSYGSWTFANYFLGTDGTEVGTAQPHRDPAADLAAVLDGR